MWTGDRVIAIIRLKDGYSRDIRKITRLSTALNDIL